jgi:sugar lactone lactonase YvrE
MKSRVKPAALHFALATSTFFTFLFAQQVLAQKVFTIAGGYVGDGKPATAAALGFAQFAAFNSKGDLLISDGVNCRIRKVDSQGIISTIAGSDICGFGGDGGPALQARLTTPTGIAVDPAGNIFFADQDTERVRKIDPAGTITTIAGNGSAKYCGDGKQGVKACLSLPTQVTLGRSKGGEILYIADTFNNRIRQVVLSTGIITTVAGNGTAGYSGDGGPAKKASLNAPSGVTFYGATHTLWISDTGNAAVRQVDLNTGIITTFLGDGTCPFMPLTLCSPMGITTDSAGNLHVADNGTGQVLRISVPGKSVSLDAGVVRGGFNGDGIPAKSAQFLGPSDVVLDSNGDVLTLDTGNGRVRKGSGSQNIMTVAGGYLGDGKPAISGAFNGPTNTAFDQLGNLYIADTSNNRIRKVTPRGEISTFAGNGLSEYSGDGGPATKASLNCPFGVATDISGNVFIADTCNSVVRKVDTSNTISTFASIPMAQSMTTDPSGDLYVADGIPNCVIWKITPGGNPSIVAGVAQRCGFSGDGGPATQAFLNRPFGVALDSAGNLYIGDSRNQRVRLVDGSGTIHTVAGNGTCGFSGDGGPGTRAMICRPEGLALDAKGNLYIADLGNARVRILSGAGIIRTFAGTGKFAYNGNGLPALKTNIAPFSVAVSPAGRLYIVDVGNNRVRKVQ